MHGKGKMTYKQSGDVYDGEWKDGQRHGKGKMTFKQSGMGTTANGRMVKEMVNVR